MKYLNKENEWVNVEMADEGELVGDTLIQMDMNELNEIINDEIDEVEDEKSMRLDISNVLDIQLDKKEVAKGIKSISEICGKIIGLKSCGLDSSQALEYVLNEMTIEHNQKLNKENNDTLLENTRLQSIKVENAQL